MNPSPYQTDEQRKEARRESYRESKRRSKMARDERKAFIADLLERMISSGNGTPERRALIIQAEINRRANEETYATR